ncbi:hemerythrin domain-containing protein [Streptomyces iconiensis]|uniref:Hemerythrin domain-containing protein n=1 Tax=Streptomyces iconiensis TaxID=1384038 RepID=A0ABT6ZZ76_9ACTN|nr:hemerythrin domain-containing protein [Streptomyces iconiensis]MDJ1134377.1 hemerythrin domain-containing protein [Streptomyces iconiensis]
MAHKQDVLELLMDDHREAERVYAAYEATRDLARRRALAQQLVAWTVRHVAAREAHLHPALVRSLPDGELTVAAWPARRAAVEATVRDMEAADPTTAAFDNAVQALMGWIQGHITEEETETFPRLRTALTARERFDLGARAEQARRRALDPGPGVLDRLRAWLTRG